MSNEQVRSGDDTGVTIFYAVPVKDPADNSDTSLERCFYFDRNWGPVDAKKLKANKGDSFVRIQQMGQFIPETVALYIKEQKRDVNLSVALFSAIAKTLGGTADMPNTFMGRGDLPSQYVTVPIAPGTTRGVILIFAYPAQGAPTTLIATSDPEVKSGSSN